MGSGAERSSKSRRTQRSTEAPKHRSKKPGMKKTGKRKPYFKPLFKVNASKSEDVEKQSQLMLENHKKLTNSTTTTTTKDGLRRNHAKPKKNQYVLVHSFLDDNDVEPTEERAAAKVGGHGHLHHPFDMDLGFNRGVGGVRRSSSCKALPAQTTRTQRRPCRRAPWRRRRRTGSQTCSKSRSNATARTRRTTQRCWATVCRVRDWPR